MQESIFHQRPPATCRDSVDTPSRDGQEGAILVEFSVVLFFFFLIFLAFVQISTIFLAHERATYAAYVGARANAVGIDSGGVGRAVHMVGGKEYQVSGDTVRVHDPLPVPLDLHAIYTKGGSTYDIYAQYTIPREREDSGDNTR